MTGPAFDGALLLGSLAVRASVEHDADVNAVEAMFKQCLAPGSSGSVTPAFEGCLSITRAPADRGLPALTARVEPDGLVIDEDAGVVRMATEVVTASLDRSQAPWRAEIVVAANTLDHHLLRVHLSVVLHRLLLALGAAYLHAAAVQVDGATHLFVGEKGAGKTTLCLALAKGGAVVLSDDHVLVRRRGDQFVVSGCERLSRVTAQTEAFVFDRPLAVPAADFAGTLKKEFVVAEHFRSAPHEDAVVRAIHFPRVGARLDSRRRPAMDTAIDLLSRTRRSYRPTGARDVSALLDFWAGLAAAAPAFDLELSEDLADLSRLRAVLT